MNFKQKNVATLLVAKGTVTGAGGVAGATTLGAGNNINDEKAGMFDGEPAVISAGGVVVDAAGTLAQRFKVAVKLTNGDLKMSNTIDAKKVTKVTVHKYTAGANQVDYIGYNGTTGSIDVIDNNVYKINIYMRGTTATDFSRMQVKHGVYKSDSAATQSEIAAGLTNSLITNFSREGSKLADNIDVIKFERINSGAQKNAMASATATVINGSKYVTLSEDESLTCAAGDIIRFGTSGAGTAPCYVVSAISASGLLITLDIPYQGASETIAHTSVETVTEGNWGIKMTGAVLPFNEWNLPYDRSTWTFGLQDFGSTITTNSTVMSLGSGEGKAIQELEAWCSMNAGRQYLNATGVVYPTLYSSATGTYALIHIQYQPEYVTELGHKVDEHAELWIACEKANATCYTDNNVGLGDTIDAYATTYGWDITRVGTTTTAGTINT